MSKHHRRDRCRCKESRRYREERCDRGERERYGRDSMYLAFPVGSMPTETMPMGGTCVRTPRGPICMMMPRDGRCDGRY